MTNEEKIKRLNLRKTLKILIIIFATLTIILAMLSLIINLTPVYAIISFIIEAGLTKYREKLDLKKQDSYEKTKK